MIEFLFLLVMGVLGYLYFRCWQAERAVRREVRGLDEEFRCFMDRFYGR